MTSAPSTKLRPVWPLAVFAVVSLGCGWVGIALDRAAGTPLGTEGPGIAFWLVAPLTVAMLLRLVTGGWALAGLRPRPAAWAWYLVAIAIPAVLATTLVGSAAALGVADLGGDWHAWALGGLALIGLTVVKNVFEEFAWRGYLTAELVDRRCSDWTLYLTVALVWGLWHLPYYHRLLDPADIADVLPIAGLWFGLWACLAIGGMAVTLAELFRASGSVWPCVLLHTAHNCFVDRLQVDGPVTINPAASWWFSPIVGALSAAGYLAVGLGLRRRRLRRAQR